MTRHALAAALVAGLVLLAGCSGGFTGASDGTATEESALDGETTAEEIQGETGTVNMYISDERNAIEEFEHLNVTITRVGVKPAGDDGGDEADADDSDGTDDANTTDAAATDTETPEADEEDDEPDVDDAEREGADDDEADGDDAEDGEWVEYEVDNRTVDLTQLKGANATKLSTLEMANGTYEKVFVYVSTVDGTLKDGSDQRVKLPSGKLQLDSEFTVGDGGEVDFVFDTTAFEAGNSGKYILKPVISESGTDVEIDDVDEADDEREDESERDGDRDALNASFDGDVVAGENATVTVTQAGDPVEGATVFVGGERAGTTDAGGASVIQVPDDAEELDVVVTYRGNEAEVEVELDDASDGDGATADDSQQRLTVG
jgi:hypothetical protein